jgi:hypothetical protein
MIDPDALNVWFEDRLVGYLWRNPIGTIGFRYGVGGRAASSPHVPDGVRATLRGVSTTPVSKRR